MLIKVIALFLVVMVALAVFGRLRFPTRSGRKLPPKPGKLTHPKTCDRCGKYIIGSGGCDCSKTPPGKG